MNDYILDGQDKIYNIWEADRNTRLYKNEMLRNLHLFNILMKRKNIDSLIDIGCGTGYLSYLLAQSGKKITAVDMSSKRLSIFKDIASKYKIEQKNKDLYNLEESGFDGVVSQEVLEHLENYESALNKMQELIRDNGTGLLCVPYNENLEAKLIIDPATGEKVHKVGHLHSFTKKKLINSVRNNGFSVIKVFLLVNKRTYKLSAKYDIPINKLTLKIDRVMNFLFPKKAAYLAILCSKKI